MKINDYRDFKSHVMDAYTATQEGLNNIYDSGDISSEEYIKTSRKNFTRYKEKSEAFAKRRWGDDWQEKLNEVSDFNKFNKKEGIMGVFMKWFGVAIGVLMLVLMTSCTQANFSAFFTQLGREVVLEKVSYKMPLPKADTTIVWYAPYKIFQNRTTFASDSIYHSEEFNWQGLGDFLYEKYQERKERRNKKDTLNISLIKYNKDMLTEIYTSIGNHIKECDNPAITHVDIWNNQPANEAVEKAYNRPACFLAFDRIEPESEVFGKKSANISLSIYIEQESYEDTHISSSSSSSSISILDVLDNVSDWINGFEPVLCERLDLVEIDLDENFSNKIVYRMRFKTRYSSCRTNT